MQKDLQNGANDENEEEVDPVNRPYKFSGKSYAFDNEIDK